jgi:uncharacterized damage-inducible protein DinB
MSKPRPRSYCLKNFDGFSDVRVANFDAVFAESAERLLDLIHTLSSVQLCTAPAPANIAIAQLVSHIVWGECQWINRITGVEIPESLALQIAGGSPTEFIGAKVSGIAAADLCVLVRYGRYEYSREALKGITDIGKPIEAKQGPSTVYEVLMHLVWHWTYHSGQIGLLRDFVGAEYAWCFEKNDADSTS